MSTTVYDAVVVGAGVVGLASAYQLVKVGKKVLLLEQFPIPHTRGSSGGHSRICRKAYRQKFMAELMADAYKEWMDIQLQTQMTLFIETGLLYIAPNEMVQRELVPAMKQSGYSYELLNGFGISKRFPQLTNFSESSSSLFDPSGGVLLASKVLLALQRLFERYGGVVQDTCPVLSIRDIGSCVEIGTDGGVFTAKRVVLATGAFTNKLLRPLGLEVPINIIRTAVWYWRQTKDVYSAAAGFPTLADKSDVTAEDNTFIYIVPAMEYKDHLKLSVHDGEVLSDASKRDFEYSGSMKCKERAKKYVKKHFPHLEASPSIEENCLYAETPDMTFVIDRHPVFQNIIFATGFSGHGFKTAPTVGKLLRDMVLDATPQFDLSHFKLSRFEKVFIKGKL